MVVIQIKEFTSKTDCFHDAVYEANKFLETLESKHVISVSHQYVSPVPELGHTRGEFLIIVVYNERT